MLLLSEEDYILNFEQEDLPITAFVISYINPAFISGILSEILLIYCSFITTAVVEKVNKWKLY